MAVFLSEAEFTEFQNFQNTTLIPRQQGIIILLIQ
jgi:hypothetical protein